MKIEVRDLTVTDYLNRPEVRNLLSPEQRYVKFVWGIPQVQATANDQDNSIEKNY